MKEDFLYYIWQYQLFFKTTLKTVTNKDVYIQKVGSRNLNSGPDFLNAHIKIGDQLWVGNVEMHIKSSDWYLHNHEEDSNYDAVILHVVWEDDIAVFSKNNEVLPTIELKNIVAKNVLNNYKSLFYKKQNWIPCESQIATINNFIFKNWLERLYFDRLEQKSVFIKKLLDQFNFDFEAVLFKLLAKNFGLKVNAEAFLQLANAIDFSIIRKIRFDEKELMALFFGQAGFLEDDLEDTYYTNLKSKYNYLKHKYQLKPISKNNFQFFRMRPNNFPTIRIAQLVGLYFTHQNLFSAFISVTEHKAYYKLFTFKVDEYWETHYVFEKTSKKSPKKITKSFIDLLLINTILPLKFVYLKHRNELNEEEFLKTIQQISPEKNSIISKFSELNIEAKNALESQSLIELKNNYCAKKRCLDCAIGNHLLRNN